MRRILVTGGAGFIGSYVNALLHRKGYETLVYDNLSTGNRNMVKNGVFVEGDLRDKEKLIKTLTTFPCDAVMHFAASIDAGKSVQEPLLYYNNNVFGTLSLLEAMKDLNIEFFIFSSSAAVYGEPKVDFITEEHPLNPINPYGRSKLMIEQLLSDVEAVNGIRHTSLRYFNAAGADPESLIKNNKLDEHNLIPICLKAILNSSPITIFGTDYPTPDGTCIRDYIHVHDIGSAHLQALEQLFQGAPSGAYNLGNGEGYSVREVVNAIKKTTGKTMQIIEGKRRQGDPSRLIANAKKATDQLNWNPLFPNLSSIVEDAWKALN